MNKYARQCTKTLEGMNEGWVVGDGEEYYKYKADILARCKEAGYKGLNDAYDDDFMYYTQWEEDDYEFVEIDGVVREIDEVVKADETLGVAGIVSHDQLDTQEYNRLLKVLGVDGMLTVFERWMNAEDLKSIVSSAKDTLADNGIPLP